MYRVANTTDKLVEGCALQDRGAHDVHANKPHAPRARTQICGDWAQVGRERNGDGGAVVRDVECERGVEARGGLVLAHTAGQG